jgi:hypothetical protein
VIRRRNPNDKAKPHTRRPWNVKRIFGDPPAITGPAGGLVANVASSGHTRKELEDARLIAAAPELLLACQGVLGVLNHGTPIKEDGTPNTHWKHIDINRAVIAKATGEES